jgi:hypothetical protein
VTVRVIQKDAEEKKTSFNPRPFFRLFINWLNDLTTSDVHHDGANFQVHILLTIYSSLWCTMSNIIFYFVIAGFDCICKCIPCTATLENSWFKVCESLLPTFFSVSISTYHLSFRRLPSCDKVLKCDSVMLRIATYYYLRSTDVSIHIFVVGTSMSRQSCDTYFRMEGVYSMQQTSLISLMSDKNTGFHGHTTKST